MELWHIYAKGQEVKLENVRGTREADIINILSGVHSGSCILRADLNAVIGMEVWSLSRQEALDIFANELYNRITFAWEEIDRYTQWLKGMTKYEDK